MVSLLFPYSLSWLIPDRCRPVWLDDVVQTIVFFCILMRLPVRSSTSSVLAHGASPILVRLLCRWMRWPEATTFTIPLQGFQYYCINLAMTPAAWAGMISRTYNARREIVHGTVGDPRNWSHLYRRDLANRH